MKICSGLLAFVIALLLFAEPGKAAFSVQNLEPSIYTETGIVKSAEKVIFSKIQSRTILNISNDKYSQELAYFFHKQGFKRSPAAYVLFEDGSAISLNSEWQTNQFNSNIDQGVLFILLVYKDKFNVENFRQALYEFKNNVLSKSISGTNISSINDFEIRDFLTDKSGEESIVNFKPAEDSQNIKSYFNDIDFSNKPAPELKLQNLSVPTKSDPKKTVKAQVEIRNNSNFDFIFSENNYVQLRFEKDSVFFVNNVWLNQRTALRIKNGFIKAKNSKVFEFDLKVPIMPGQVTEKLLIEMKDKTLESKDLALEVNNIGLKLLRVRPNAVGYLNVRKEANTTSPEIGKASMGNIYSYVDLQNGFYKIDFNGKEGWVAERYVELISN